MGANAQTVVPTFTAGQVLTAAQLNQSARTGVPVFATTTDRDAAFGGTGEKTLAEGQMCYIEAAPQRLQIYDGAAWLDVDLKWQNWTPTFTNLTLGNGTLTAKYMRLGKMIMAIIQVKFGSTSSMGTNPSFTLPATSLSYATDANLGSLSILDAGTAYINGNLLQQSTTSALFQTTLTDATYSRDRDIQATIPMTWTTNDTLTSRFTYEVA